MEAQPEWARAMEERLNKKIDDEVPAWARAMEQRLSERLDGHDRQFESLNRKIDDLAEVVERMAEGHNRRFSVIEEHLKIPQEVG